MLEQQPQYSEELKPSEGPSEVLPQPRSSYTPSCILSSLYQPLSEVAQSSLLFPKLLSNNKTCHRPLKPPPRASGELELRKAVGEPEREAVKDGSRCRGNGRMKTQAGRR